jgi:hypothetical protein
MSPFSLSDDELDQVMSLAAAVPVEHRDAFLQSIADALGKYPEDSRGPRPSRSGELATLFRQFAADDARAELQAEISCGASTRAS